MPVPVRFRYATGLVKQYGRYQALHGLDLEVRPGEVFGFLRRPRNRRRRGGRHLDLLLAHPVSRTRLVLERFAALAAAVAWLGLVVWAGTLAAARAADMGIGAGPITATTLGLVLLGLGFGTVALAAGALSGRRGQVLGVSAALAVAAYLAYTVGGQVQGLEPARKLSPFYYYLGGDPLRTGADLGHLAVLAAIPLLLAALAVWGLNRRDIAV